MAKKFLTGTASSPAAGAYGGSGSLGGGFGGGGSGFSGGGPNGPGGQKGVPALNKLHGVLAQRAQVGRRMNRSRRDL